MLLPDALIQSCHQVWRLRTWPLCFALDQAHSPILNPFPIPVRKPVLNLLVVCVSKPVVNPILGFVLVSVLHPVLKCILNAAPLQA